VTTPERVPARANDVAACGHPRLCSIENTEMPKASDELRDREPRPVRRGGDLSGSRCPRSFRATNRAEAWLRRHRMGSIDAQVTAVEVGRPDGIRGTRRRLSTSRARSLYE
jgi:hypothetical protein